MALSDYISCGEVRSILGVSVRELPDDAVLTGAFEVNLLDWLAGIDTDLVATYAAAQAVSPPTADQPAFTLRVRAFSEYVTARQLIPQLPLIAPQILKAGKDEVGRVANPFTHLDPTISAQIAVLQRSVQKAYAKVNLAYVVPTALARTLVTASGISDPITGV